MNENQLGSEIVNDCFQIHQELGPGLLESVYEVILADELRSLGLSIERQKPIPIRYKELIFDEGFRADIIVENRVIIELKSVEAVSRVHSKQALTYLKLLDYRLGYLVNFGSELIKDGITRVVNRLPENE
ncbi:GxxExxY protein [Planctomycetaceae bacterium]|jgi:GxxExxY protein|nr:GxxExxY protein [Planctomycetaceae bacterium]